MSLLRAFSPFQIGMICFPNLIFIKIMIKIQKKIIFKNSHFFLEIKLIKLQLVHVHLIMALYNKKLTLKQVQWVSVAYIRSCISLSLFGMFDLTISKPIHLGKSYIPQKKALLLIVWKKFWNWKNFCYGRLHTSFSKSGTISGKVY